MSTNITITKLRQEHIVENVYYIAILNTTKQEIDFFFQVDVDETKKELKGTKLLKQMLKEVGTLSYEGYLFSTDGECYQSSKVVTKVEEFKEEENDRDGEGSD